VSLETGALKVGSEPKHFRSRQGGIHGIPVSTPDPPYFQRDLKLLTGREGWELDLLANRQIDRLQLV